MLCAPSVIETHMITPQGSVCFISNGWGGRASDKHITENCGLLNKIIPGDTILADRGFDIIKSLLECTVLLFECQLLLKVKSS